MWFTIIHAVCIFLATSNGLKMHFENGLKDPIHPVLYFTSSDAPSLIKKAATSHKKIADVIDDAGSKLKADMAKYLPPKSFEKFGKYWNERYGNSLCTFAMYCVLHPDDDEALSIVTLYMDRLTSYPDWYVTDSQGTDEVPIGHSLTGYVTAFDFLYNKFDTARKEIYLEKIVNVTRHMFVKMGTRSSSWSIQYIHNHAATNCLSVLLGALVAESHGIEEATTWRKESVEHFEKAMFLLRMVLDGSSDESVPYGTYAARGWTQYVYLAKKHLGIDHTKHPWFRNQFWLYYATVLPGYYRTVGIADSNYNWFHGPNSQLVFLDAFVMRNGYGNWLADRIREARKMEMPFLPDTTHEWSTIHTEFLFYDASIEPRPPPSIRSFHVFHDWGVVTYGGGRALQKGNTFLSMKSSAVTGEGFADIVEQRLFPDLIKSWSNINSGHEQPDQNSFIFAPNGVDFITEALYGPKFTHLNNVLKFAPSSNAKCFEPWEGQTGECSKWLNFKQNPVSRGRIVTATNSGGMVHIAGESAQAYGSYLGLQSVQRSLILLHPEVLLVIDSIYLEQGSKLERSSAFFHNIMQPFKQIQHLGHKGAEIEHPDGSYRFFWLDVNDKSLPASFHEEVMPSESKPRTTHYVNLTFPLHHDTVTRMAYVFFGPNSKVTSAAFLDGTSEEVIKFAISFNGVTYDITTASLTTSLSRRMGLLGFGGYLKIKERDVTYLFGMGGRCGDKAADNEITMALITSIKHQCVRVNQPRLETLATKKDEDEHGHKCETFPIIIFSSLPICAIFAYVVMQVKRRYIATMVVLIFLSSWSIFFAYLLQTPCPADVKLKPKAVQVGRKIVPTLYIAPTLVITSLPGSGGELMEWIFQNSTDFLYLSTQDVKIPYGGGIMKFDPCYWPQDDMQSHTTTAGWFLSMKSEPLSFLNNLREDNLKVNYVRQRFRLMNKSARFAMNLISGFWNSKLPWLHELFGRGLGQVYVVRDPRDWVYSLIREDLDDKFKVKQQQFLHDLANSEPCRSPSWLPREYRAVQDHVTENVVENVVEKLSRIWVADVKTVIGNAKLLQIVRFEDILEDPQYAATELLKFYGSTISVMQINRITRAVHSGLYDLPYEGPIHQDYTGQWKEMMSTKDVNTVENICKDMMKVLKYM